MKAEQIALNGTYRMKPEVFTGTVQANGKPHTSPDVTIVRIKTRPGRKSRFFFDAKGNAYEARDFAKATEVIEVDI